MLGYVTEKQVREQVASSFLAAIREEEERAKQAEERGVKIERKHTRDVFGDPRYERWVQDRLTSFRARGLLVTARQLEDAKNKRRLQEGDRARFVGCSRLERTRSNKMYQRNHGETGTIVLAEKGGDRRYIYTFMPDAPAGAHDPNTKHFVASLKVKEGTPGAHDLERIPAHGEPLLPHEVQS
jgi:hypothetical protein